MNRYFFFLPLLAERPLFPPPSVTTNEINIVLWSLKFIERFFFVLFSLPVCKFKTELSVEGVDGFLLLGSLVVLLEGCNADPKSGHSETISIHLVDFRLKSSNEDCLHLQSNQPHKVMGENSGKR